MNRISEGTAWESMNQQPSWAWVKSRVKHAAAAAAALLALNTAQGSVLTLDDILAKWLEGNVWALAPGSFETGANFDNFLYQTPDGTIYTTRWRLTPDSTFWDGTTDNLLIDVLDNEGNLAAYLSMGFLSSYTEPNGIPWLRWYEGRDGSKWDMYAVDNEGVPNLGIGNGSTARFDLRPLQVSNVPEPASYLLVGAWLAAVLGSRRRNGAKAESGKTEMKPTNTEVESEEPETV